MELCFEILEITYHYLFSNYKGTPFVISILHLETLVVFCLFWTSVILLPSKETMSEMCRGIKELFAIENSSMAAYKDFVCVDIMSMTKMNWNRIYLINSITLGRADII